MTDQVAGLVLAAGTGRRLGRPKAVVEVAGERLVDRAVRTLRAGGLQPIVAVLGAAVVDVPGARVVVNPDWSQGMASSLRVGLASLPDTVGAVAVLLVDQPGVTAEVVRRVVRAAQHAADPTTGALADAVVVATYDGRPGHPVLLGRAHWAEVIASAHGDAGARTFLRGHAGLVSETECGDVGDDGDVDTPADLERVRAGRDTGGPDPR